MRNNKEAESSSHKDVSIECAKAYSSDGGDAVSLNALQKKIEELKRESKTYSTVLLVDDVSYPDQTFDFDAYAAWLGKSGHEEAEIYRESQLVSICREVRGVIAPEKLDPTTGAVLDQDGHYSSEFFIATWFLLRLGHLESQIFSPELRANRLYNILPKSFEEGEKKSLAIIQATPFASAANQIEYQFIPDTTAQA